VAKLNADSSSRSLRIESAVQSRLVRLGGAFAAVALGLVALWQAGVLDSESGATASRDGVEVLLRASDVTIDTEAQAGRGVGARELDVAPDFEFSAFDGRRLRLSEFRGRPVLLNFWATWCGPCRRELPEMETLQRRYQAQGLAVIAVNTGERFAAADRYLRGIGVQLTAFAYDPASAIARRYGVEGLPVSLFIDAQGAIARIVNGQLTPALMESGVQEALAGARLR
jgi:thiol-disulfide isomerase/thioredoxin